MDPIAVKKAGYILAVGGILFGVVNGLRHDVNRWWKVILVVAMSVAVVALMYPDATGKWLETHFRM